LKKKTKKLVLAKETVRSLEVAALTRVAAGSPTDAGWSCWICEEEYISYNTNCGC
jgi:hypothetical protein